ncbi:HTH-type transcriptional regulator RutR, partial [Klebsiella pneumoniae]
CSLTGSVLCKPILTPKPNNLDRRFRIYRETLSRFSCAASLVAIREYIRLKLEVSCDHPQASKLFCLEMLQGAPLLMGELTGDLKALVDEKSAIVSGWIDRGKLAPVDPQHLIFMIWATTQHYADFATQVEAVTGATLQDAAFFEQTVDNVQRMIIEGIRVR